MVQDKPLSGEQAGCQICPKPVIGASMTSNPARLVALFGAITAAAALRLIPHPPNFSPIDAMALFSAAYFVRRPLAFLAPVAALFLSDLILGFYAGMQFQYLAVVMIVFLGTFALSRVTVPRLVAASLASSLLFFTVTNFGVWLVSGMYPHSVAGLGACYLAGIPFFQNSLAGDLFYTAVLFGGFAIAEAIVPRLKSREPQPA
jgi:hypothetical protein